MTIKFFLSLNSTQIRRPQMHFNATQGELLVTVLVTRRHYLDYMFVLLGRSNLAFMS
jgi:hypothetical protein